MHAIQVQNMSVEYRRTFKPPIRAVNQISFAVGPAEIVGFLGVNGAGKSSTIKALMGFQPLTEGTACVFGEPVGSVDAKRQIGFLPETATYSPYLTPFETMKLYATLHGIPATQHNDTICELLERVGMMEKRNTLNKGLSKGMLQRVGIAQALIGSPRLLILDEVSSGLDPIGRRDLRRILSDERERGATIFFSSHNLNEVESLCDRVIILHKGHIVDEQRIVDLIQHTGSIEEHFIRVIENVETPNPQLEIAA